MSFLERLDLITGVIQILVFIGGAFGLYYKMRMDIQKQSDHEEAERKAMNLRLDKIELQMDEIRKDRVFRWDCYEKEQKGQIVTLNDIKTTVSKISTDMDWVKGIVKSNKE